MVQTRTKEYTMQNHQLKKSCEAVINQMIDLKYSRSVIGSHRQSFSMLQKFAAQKGAGYFTHQLGDEFLKETFGYSVGMRVSELKHIGLISVEAMKRLAEYTTCGCVRRKADPGPMSEWALEDAGLLNAYLDKKRKQGLSERSILTATHCLQVFYRFLKTAGLTTIMKLTREVISNYWISMQGDSQAYCRDRIWQLAQYLKFLFLNGFMETDISGWLPKVRVTAKKWLPAIWTRENAIKLLNSIDRENPVGKRDYAAYIMVAELGLRASDINNMKLSDLNWDTNEITVTQCKTGKLNVLPMTPDVGWALIDYIKHGRPQCDEPYVFLTGNVPYSKLRPTTLVLALTRYRKRCGLFIGRPDTVAGMHSFRHALAHRLLDKGVDLEMISEIMGHTHVSSSSPYLKIDIEGLRSCALDLEEVKAYATDIV